jgi:hypothetical protein
VSLGPPDPSVGFGHSTTTGLTRGHQWVRRANTGAFSRRECDPILTVTTVDRKQSLPH